MADKYTEDDFYDIIDESLNEPVEARQWPFYAMDYIASIEEWDAFKAAMARWMEKMERESLEGFFQVADEAAEDDEDDSDDD